MNSLNSDIVRFINATKETFEEAEDGLAFYRQIGPIGAILLGIAIVLFLAANGFGIFITIKHFLRKDVVNVQLKKRRLLIVVQTYVWSILLGCFVLIFNDLTNFPTTDLPPNHAFYNWPTLVLFFPSYAKFHFIFYLNFHYALIRNEIYSNWKMNYVLENYRLYFGLLLAEIFIYLISLGFWNMQTPYLIFMLICVLIIMFMIAVNLGESNKLQFDAEQPETQFKAMIQVIHFVSMIISASALTFYSAQSIEVRLFVMMLIFIEPALLTLSQYLIYCANHRDTSATLFDAELHQE